MNHAKDFAQRFDLASFLEHARTHFGLHPVRSSATSAVVAHPSQPASAKNWLLAASVGFTLAAPAAVYAECFYMGARGAHPEHHARMIEQHHQQLRDSLKLSPEQQSGWQNLLDSEQAIRQPARPLVDDWSKLTTPERAEKMLAMAQARNERLSQHVAALKSFYASLSAEQKKTFDDMHVNPGDGFRGRPGPRPPIGDKSPARN